MSDNNINTFFWHRRDLRIQDNAGLYHALKYNKGVQAIFIFDRSILDELPKKDKRVIFIYKQIEHLKQKYQALGSDLLVYYGNPLEVFKKLNATHPLQNVYTNHDYEPSCIERDAQIASFLNKNDCQFKTFKDQVIFEKNEITKSDKAPYTVFTPYSKQWKKKLNSFYTKPYPTEKYLSNLKQSSGSSDLITLEKMGFSIIENLGFSKLEFNADIIKDYHQQRDFPAVNGTSRLSIHLRFGTTSIREATGFALKHNTSWLNELIWRDFYMGNILAHFPMVVSSCFKKKYERIEWRNNPDEFEAWKNGKTGYPIVDAGMRELNQTGFMHNRVRMITASFLTKHLLIDWRWGEAYFAEKLLDYDLSANNGGWQWAASCGCDAAPYFRIFNPYLQTKKFDPQLAYIRKWCPEFEDVFSYPKPIVEHKFARQRALEVYKKALRT